MAYSEDDLTEVLIQRYQDRDIVHIIEPEAHYDHYGHRGWPDLFVVFERAPEGLIEHHLIEVKSEYAVKSATGANEIIRQFNQMRRYFFDDERHNLYPMDHDYQEIVIDFELTFIPTPYTIQHLHNYAEMYNQAISATSPDRFDLLPSDQGTSGIHEGIEVNLTLRHPEYPFPVALVTKGGSNFSPSSDPDAFYEDYKRRNLT